MDNLTEEENTYLIVALVLMMMAMQLNILQEQSMIMTVMGWHFMQVENTVWCIYL